MGESLSHFMCRWRKLVLWPAMVHSGPLQSANLFPVVDSECRVHGLQGLRVTDVGILRGHPPRSAMVNLIRIHHWSNEHHLAPFQSSSSHFASAGPLPYVHGAAAICFVRRVCLHLPVTCDDIIVTHLSDDLIALAASFQDIVNALRDLAKNPVVRDVLKTLASINTTIADLHNRLTVIEGQNIQQFDSLNDIQDDLENTDDRLKALEGLNIQQALNDISNSLIRCHLRLAARKHQSVPERHTSAYHQQWWGDTS